MAPSSPSSSPAPSLTSSVIILLHVTFSNRDLAPALRIFPSRPLRAPCVDRGRHAETLCILCAPILMTVICARVAAPAAAEEEIRNGGEAAGGGGGEKVRTNGNAAPTRTCCAGVRQIEDRQTRQTTHVAYTHARARAHTHQRDRIFGRMHAGAYVRFSKSHHKTRQRQERVCTTILHSCHHLQHHQSRRRHH